MLTTPLEVAGRKDMALYFRLNVSFALAYAVGLFGPRLFADAPAAKFVVGLVPLLVFTGVVLAEVQALKRADELRQRIQVEALAIAYPVSLLMVMTVLVFQRLTPFSDWGIHALAILINFPYMLGLSLARKRYL